MTANELLALLRKRLKLNQIAMAKLLGISQGALSKIENHHLHPQLSTYRAACRLAYEKRQDALVQKFQEHLFE